MDENLARCHEEALPDFEEWRHDCIRSYCTVQDLCLDSIKMRICLALLYFKVLYWVQSVFPRNETEKQWGRMDVVDWKYMKAAGEELLLHR